MNKITHIIFDLFNTLYRFDPERENTQIDAAKIIGIKISKKEINDALNQADKWFAKETAKNSMHLMSEEEKDLFYSNYEKILFNYAGHEISNEQSGIVWNFVKGMKSSLKLFDDASDLLNILKREKVITCIVTNFDSDGRILSKSLNVPNLVDYVITSKDAGAQKPSIEIFNYSLNFMNAKPENCIFIGDQIETDIKGALKANIKPFLIDRDKIHDEFNECIVINSLTELLKFINLQSN